MTVSDDVWNLAVRRAAVIGPLAGSGAVGLAAADAAAAELGVSHRRVCLMLRRWREGEGVVSDLIPGRSSGGRGRGHLPDEVEAVIRELLRTRYLNRQKRSMAAVHRELARICRSRHTEVDLILVDERHRLPIGRPYLTSMASIREWMRGV